MNNAYAGAAEVTVVSGQQQTIEVFAVDLEPNTEVDVSSNVSPMITSVSPKRNVV